MTISASNIRPTTLFGSDGAPLPPLCSETHQPELHSAIPNDVNALIATTLFLQNFQDFLPTSDSETVNVKVHITAHTITVERTDGDTRRIRTLSLEGQEHDRQAEGINRAILQKTNDIYFRCVEHRPHTSSSSSSSSTSTSSTPIMPSHPDPLPHSASSPDSGLPESTPAELPALSSNPLDTSSLPQDQTVVLQVEEGTFSSADNRQPLQVEILQLPLPTRKIVVENWIDETVVIEKPVPQILPLPVERFIPQAHIDELTFDTDTESFSTSSEPSADTPTVLAESPLEIQQSPPTQEASEATTNQETPPLQPAATVSAESQTQTLEAGSDNTAPKEASSDTLPTEKDEQHPQPSALPRTVDHTTMPKESQTTSETSTQPEPDPTRTITQEPAKANTATVLAQNAPEMQQSIPIQLNPMGTTTQLVAHLAQPRIGRSLSNTAIVPSVLQQFSSELMQGVLGNRRIPIQKRFVVPFSVKDMGSPLILQMESVARKRIQKRFVVPFSVKDMGSPLILQMESVARKRISKTTSKKFNSKKHTNPSSTSMEPPPSSLVLRRPSPVPATIRPSPVPALIRRSLPPAITRQPLPVRPLSRPPAPVRFIQRTLGRFPR